MLSFEEFRSIMKSEYVSFHEKAMSKSKKYILEHNIVSELEKSAIYSEIVTIDLLNEYHKWLSNQME